MLRLLRIIAMVVVIIIVLNKGSIVRSARFCAYLLETSTCPGDDQQVEIKYPFWIENRNFDGFGDCTSYPGFQVICAANGRPVISIANNFYYVLNIDPFGLGGTLRVVDVDIDAQDCPQPRRNISIETARFLSYESRTINMSILYNCSRYPPNVVQHMPCLDNYHNNNTTTGRRSFAFFDQEISSRQFDWHGNCEDTVVVPVINDYGGDLTQADFTRVLKSGFYLDWGYPASCRNCELSVGESSGGKCWANETNQGITTPFHCDCPDGRTLVDRTCSYWVVAEVESGIARGLKIVIAISFVVVGLLISLLVLCRRKCYPLCNLAVSSCRKKIKGPTDVEVFLDINYGGRSSQSYKYSDIKKMTNSFKVTLGQGGYGSVFKGKLRDGRLVAVKVLNESKGKGEDFINEVATIGRTNHVNVVSLLGFCAEGTKRALVYEFMPNGSLEKFIHNAKDSSTPSSFLGWEKLYQIALGIASGLEYLHRGCNTRILHFDIKPHNILLDQDFCPKISDFGLAKLCPTRESLVSMVGARGTIGYIAPEVFCRNFGGVSNKSDVYSYGMMVLEMIGGRKNIDVTLENISEIYFPQWIYNRVRYDIQGEGSEKSKVVVCGEVFAESVTQKMIIVALWCIQAQPRDRPSMTKVVEMLEGNAEDLQLPPNPFPNPSSNPFPSSP